LQKSARALHGERLLHVFPPPCLINNEEVDYVPQNREVVLLAGHHFFLSLCPLALGAQGSSTQRPQEKKAEQKPARYTETVTGCLQKSNEPGEFSITGEDGKTWGLYSTSVKLDKHLGHTVTVIGSRTYEAKAKEKKEGQVERASSKQE
jgi:hypothetical protein